MYTDADLTIHMLSNLLDYCDARLSVGDLGHHTEAWFRLRLRLGLALDAARDLRDMQRGSHVQ